MGDKSSKLKKCLLFRFICVFPAYYALLDPTGHLINGSSDILCDPTTAAYRVIKHQVIYKVADHQPVTLLGACVNRNYVYALNELIVCMI
jgi:azurin